MQRKLKGIERGEGIERKAEGVDALVQSEHRGVRALVHPTGKHQTLPYG